MINETAKQINHLLANDLPTPNKDRNFWVLFDKNQTPYLAEVGRINPNILPWYEDNNLGHALQDFSVHVYQLHPKNAVFSLSNEPDAICDFHTHNHKQTEDVHCYLDVIHIMNKDLYHLGLGRELITLLHYLTMQNTPSTEMMGHVNARIGHLNKTELEKFYKKTGHKIDKKTPVEHYVQKKYHKGNAKKQFKHAKNRIINVPGKDYDLTFLLPKEMVVTSHTQPTTPEKQK